MGVYTNLWHRISLAELGSCALFRVVHLEMVVQQMSSRACVLCALGEGKGWGKRRRRKKKWNEEEEEEKEEKKRVRSIYIGWRPICCIIL